MQKLVLRSVLPAVPNTFTLQRSYRASRIRVMSKAPQYDIAVKGAGDKLGDCPFCHRALLALEEKHVPYSKTLIDFDNKPQWLTEVNPAGSVPVMKELETGKWIVDSGTIVDYLEEKFPEPKLGTVEGSPQIGLDVLPKMKNFITSGPEESQAKASELLESLRALDAHLQSHGPFIGGSQPSSTDLAVMPRLYHMQVATKHFRNWEVPAELTALKKYMDTFMARESWRNTYYSPDTVIAGWAKHGAKKL